jgi:hypothetical protein
MVVGPDPYGSSFSRLFTTRKGTPKTLVVTRILTGPHSVASYDMQGTENPL